MHSEPATGMPQKTKGKSRGDRACCFNKKHGKTHVRHSTTTNLEVPS